MERASFGPNAQIPGPGASADNQVGGPSKDGGNEGKKRKSFSKAVRGFFEGSSSPEPVVVPQVPISPERTPESQHNPVLVQFKTSYRGTVERRVEFLERVPILLETIYNKPRRCVAVSMEHMHLMLNGRLGYAYIIDFQSMDVLPRTTVQDIVDQLQIVVHQVTGMPAKHGLIRIMPPNVFGELFWNPNPSPSSSTAPDALRSDQGSLPPSPEFGVGVRPGFEIEPGIYPESEAGPVLETESFHQFSYLPGSMDTS